MHHATTTTMPNGEIRRINPGPATVSGNLEVYAQGLSRSPVPFPGPQSVIPTTFMLSGGEEGEIEEVLRRAYERYRRELLAALNRPME